MHEPHIQPPQTSIKPDDMPRLPLTFIQISPGPKMGEYREFARMPVLCTDILTAQTHDPPFWDDNLQPNYSRWWRPQEVNRTTLYPRPLSRFTFRNQHSWFHHEQYEYPSPHVERRLRPVTALNNGIYNRKLSVLSYNH